MAEPGWRDHLRSHRYEAAGLALVVGFVAWSWLSALEAGTSAWAHTATAATAALGYWLSRRLAQAWAWAIPFAIAVVVLLAFMASGPDGWSGGPTVPPLHYANANGALAAAGAGAALVAAALAPRRVRLACILLSAVLVFTAVATTSRAAAVGAVLTVVLVGVCARCPTLRRPAVVMAGGMAVLALGVSLALGAGVGEDTDVGSAVEASLSDRRADLWWSAMKLARDHPIAGVGPRQFPEQSRVSKANPEFGEAHSAPLQAAAELGLPGAALVLGIAAWSLAGGWFAPAAGSLSATVGTIVAGTAAAQAGIDYIAQFPAVVLTVAAVLGAAHGARPTPEVAVAADPAGPVRARVLWW